MATITKSRKKSKKEVNEVEINWVPDDNFEKILRDEGIEWEIVDYDLSKVNWKKSAANMGRPQKALDDDRVVELGMSMEAGLVIPMPVIAVVRKDDLINSGSHRSAAARLVGCNIIKAYLIHLDDIYQFRKLSEIANRIIGVANPTSVALDQAQHMVTDGHLTLGEAAAQYRVVEGTLAHRVSAAMARKRMEEDFGLQPDPNDMKNIHCEVLGRLEHNDTIFREASRLVIDYPKMFSQEKLVGFVRDIKRQKTESTQLDVIMKERAHQLALAEDLKRKGKDKGKNNKPASKFGMSNKTKLLREVRTLNNILAFGDSIASFGFDVESQECKAFRKECSRAGTSLKNLFKK